MPRSLVHKKSKATAVVHPYGSGARPDSPASSTNSQQKGKFMTEMGLVPKPLATQRKKRFMSDSVLAKRLFKAAPKNTRLKTLTIRKNSKLASSKH